MNNYLFFRSGADVLASVGQKLGPGDWLLVDQARINAFAQASEIFNGFMSTRSGQPMDPLEKPLPTAFFHYLSWPHY